MSDTPRRAVIYTPAPAELVGTGRRVESWSVEPTAVRPREAVVALVRSRPVLLAGLEEARAGAQTVRAALAEVIADRAFLENSRGDEMLAWAGCADELMGLVETLCGRLVGQPDGVA